jgi:hypothetical protein
MGIIKEMSSVGSGLEINEALARGHVFESTVRRSFPESDFALMFTATGHHELDMPFTRETRDPELKYRHLLTGIPFWVTCHYSPEIHYSKVKWCDGFQLDRYRWFQENIGPETVYVIIGVGGWAREPEYLFCLPLNNARQPSLYMDTLKPFRHEAQLAFKFVDGRLR